VRKAKIIDGGVQLKVLTIYGINFGSGGGFFRLFGIY
jgi:hypothetical protein